MTTDETIFIAQAIVDVAMQYGVIVAFFAVIGFLFFLNASFRVSAPMIEMLVLILVITPIIVYRSIIGKDDSIKRDMVEIWEHALKNKYATCGFVTWVGVCVIAMYVLVRIFVYDWVW